MHIYDIEKGENVMFDEKEQAAIQPSKKFLLPFILLVLSKMPSHGYELIQRLHSFGFHALDQGNLYRMLRQLEKESLVESTWDTSGTGPAKRRYSITETGRTYLQGYANQLERYQSMLNQFFKMYGSFIELYIPSYSKEGGIENMHVEKERNKNGRNER